MRKKGFDPSDREKQIPIQKQKKSFHLSHRRRRRNQTFSRHIYFCRFPLFFFTIPVCSNVFLSTFFLAVVVIHFQCYQHDFIIVFLVAVVLFCILFTLSLSSVSLLFELRVVQPIVTNKQKKNLNDEQERHIENYLNKFEIDSEVSLINLNH